MKFVRTFLVFILALVSPGASAQDTLYLGVRLVLASPLETIFSFGSVQPFLGLQLGVRALDPLELRAAYDVSLGLEYASADLLYSYPLYPDTRVYVGLGPDYYADGWNGETDYGVHLTGGAEYRAGIIGLFGELQPIYGLGIAALRMRFASGVNFHF